MIYMLSGTICQIASQFVIVDTAGVGYGIHVAQEHVYAHGQSAKLYIHYHFNAETGPQLYGFDSELAKLAFTTIISCSGIGPKIGLALLNHISPDQFFQAVLMGDHKTLSAVSGIGPKKAESIILQLKDKVAKLDLPASGQTGSDLAVIKQVSEVLHSLNYSRGEVSFALDQLKQQGVHQVAFDEMLRKTLAVLAKNV